MPNIRRYDGPALRRKEDNYSLKFSDPFERDFFSVTTCQSFRRTPYKTQVFRLPKNPHVRKRSQHTNEVISIAASIADRLDLNRELCKAGAACHDIGHTPYGHNGERVLSRLGGKEFRHEVFSVVVAQNFEMLGEGLNLTGVVLEIARDHSRGFGELTVDRDGVQESGAVMIGDKIGYTMSDTSDTLSHRPDLLKEGLPDFAYALGMHRIERINNCIDALVEESLDKGYVCFKESKVAENFEKLRKFLQESVYKKVDLPQDEENLRRAHAFFAQYLPTQEGYEQFSPIIACALLTDEEADEFAPGQDPEKLPTFEQVKHFGFFQDILPYVKGRDVDYTNPDLDWIHEKRE